MKSLIPPKKLVLQHLKTATNKDPNELQGKNTINIHENN
jgi:hypothetical protein